MSVQKGLFNSVVQDCTKILNLYSPQTEGNKDCETHRCVDFLYTDPLSPIIKLEVDKIGQVHRLKICRSLTT